MSTPSFVDSIPVRMKALRYRVTGRVQGVGFRWFVCQTARDLGIQGWVRNTPAGEVEGEASGDPLALEAFSKALREGPSLAKVTGFTREAIEPSSVNAGFEVRG